MRRGTGSSSPEPGRACRYYGSFACAFIIGMYQPSPVLSNALPFPPCAQLLHGIYVLQNTSSAGKGTAGVYFKYIVTKRALEATQRRDTTFLDVVVLHTSHSLKFGKRKKNVPASYTLHTFQPCRQGKSRGYRADAWPRRCRPCAGGRCGFHTLRTRWAGSGTGSVTCSMFRRPEGGTDQRRSQGETGSNPKATSIKQPRRWRHKEASTPPMIQAQHTTVYNIHTCNKR